jgi:hypothetical protein
MFLEYALKCYSLGLIVYYQRVSTRVGLFMDRRSVDKTGKPC